MTSYPIFAIRRNADYPHKGRIMSLAVGLVDDAGTLSAPAAWKLHSLHRFVGGVVDHYRPQIMADISGEDSSTALLSAVENPGRLSPALDVESQLRDVKLMALVADDPHEDEFTANEVAGFATDWWKENVGTDRYAANKPWFIGFKPEVTRAWLIHHFPTVAEPLGDSIDILSAAWVQDLSIPDRPETVGDEVEWVAQLVKACRA